MSPSCLRWGHSPGCVVLGGRLQILLNALVVVYLSWDGDGDRGAISAAGEDASSAVGERCAHVDNGGQRYPGPHSVHIPPQGSRQGPVGPPTLCPGKDRTSGQTTPGRLGDHATGSLPAHPPGCALLTQRGWASYCRMRRGTGSGHGSPGLQRPPANCCGTEGTDVALGSQLFLVTSLGRGWHLKASSPKRAGCSPAAEQAVRRGLGTSRLSHQVTCRDRTTSGQVFPALQSPPHHTGAPH